MSTTAWCSVSAVPLGHESRAAWVVLSFQISVTSCLGECGIRHHCMWPTAHARCGLAVIVPKRNGRALIRARRDLRQVGGQCKGHGETRGLARSSSSCLRHKSAHFESSSSLMYSPRVRVCAQLPVAVSPSCVARPNRQVRGVLLCERECNTKNPPPCSPSRIVPKWQPARV